MRARVALLIPGLGCIGLLAVVGLVTIGPPAASAALGDVSRVRLGPPSSQLVSHQEGERTCELVLPFRATVVGIYSYRVRVWIKPHAPLGYWYQGGGADAQWTGAGGETDRATRALVPTTVALFGYGNRILRRARASFFRALRRLPVVKVVAKAELDGGQWDQNAGTPLLRIRRAWRLRPSALRRCRTSLARRA